MTQICREPGLQSISCLPFLPLPKLLLTQLSWAGELCPHTWVWSSTKPCSSKLRGIPESHWRNLAQGPSGRGFHHRRITSVEETQQSSLISPHPYMRDLLLVPSAKWSLTGTADDNFLPKTLVPKDGFIGENILQSEFFFSSRTAEENVAIFSSFINSSDT